MSPEEFRDVVTRDPYLRVPVTRAAEAAPARQQFGGGEAVLIAAMFPLVHFTVTRVGLPGLHEGARYLDLWRQKFGRWVDEEYRAAGFDPAQAAAAGEALARELQQTTSSDARNSWKRLRDLLLKGAGGGA